MVVKARNLQSYADYRVNTSAPLRIVLSTVYERCADSSATGSARTEVSAVDRFLAAPSNRHDFHRALRADLKTVGDLGLADFRVDRIRSEWIPASFTAVGNTGVRTSVENWIRRTPAAHELPVVVPYQVPTKAGLSVMGQQLYDRALPNRAQADLGQAVAEIASNPVRALMLPGHAHLSTVSRNVRAIQSQARARHRAIAGLPLEEARAAADDYLTYIFGVRPNVKTLDDLADALSRSRRLAETVSRMGRKRVRRRRGNPSLQRISTKTVSSNITYPASNLGSSWVLDGTSHAFSEATQDSWWSGAFRMSVSDTDDWLGRCSDFFKTIDLISGVGLDIRTAWDIVPFSFMADWFANTGDFLENRQIVADYNIACEYGYAMCHTRFQQVVTASGTFRRNTSSLAQRNFYGYAGGSVLYQYLEETKLRTRCNSYGFFSPYEGLNEFQWGALAALGLSALPGIPPHVRT